MGSSQPDNYRNGNEEFPQTSQNALHEQRDAAKSRCASLQKILEKILLGFDRRRQIFKFPLVQLGRLLLYHNLTLPIEHQRVERNFIDMHNFPLRAEHFPHKKTTFFRKPQNDKLLEVQ